MTVSAETCTLAFPVLSSGCWDVRNTRDMAGIAQKKEICHCVADLKDRHRRRQELARTRAVRAVSSQPAKPRGSPAVISQLPPSLPLRPLLPWGSGQAAASPAGWHALPCPWPLPTLQGLNLLHLQFFDLFWFPFFWTNWPQCRSVMFWKPSSCELETRVIKK